MPGIWATTCRAGQGGATHAGSALLAQLAPVIPSQQIHYVKQTRARGGSPETIICIVGIHMIILHLAPPKQGSSVHPATPTLSVTRWQPRLKGGKVNSYCCHMLQGIGATDWCTGSSFLAQNSPFNSSPQTKRLIRISSPCWRAPIHCCGCSKVAECGAGWVGLDLGFDPVSVIMPLFPGLFLCLCLSQVCV